MSERRGLRGYVTARGFGPYVIPVPVQSLALRDYCARKKFIYVLPANENCFPHSYLVLEGMIGDLSGYEGIVMCSMHMLPHRAERRRGVCHRVFEQGCSLHLVLEDFVVEEAELSTPFKEPIVPLSSIAQYRKDHAPGKRVHVTGIVTLQRLGEDFFLQDATGGLRVRTRQAETLAVGDRVEAVGFPDFEHFLTVLQDATFRKMSEPKVSVRPITVSTEELQEGLHHAAPVGHSVA